MLTAVLSVLALAEASVSVLDICGHWKEAGLCMTKDSCGGFTNSTTDIYFGMPNTLVEDQSGNTRFNMTTRVFMGNACGPAKDSLSVSYAGTLGLMENGAYVAGATLGVFSVDTIEVHPAWRHDVIYHWPDGICANALEYLNYHCPCGGSWLPGFKRTVVVEECPEHTCPAFSKLTMYANMQTKGYQAISMSGFYDSYNLGKKASESEYLFNHKGNEGCFRIDGNGYWCEDKENKDSEGLNWCSCTNCEGRECDKHCLEEEDKEEEKEEEETNTGIEHGLLFLHHHKKNTGTDDGIEVQPEPANYVSELECQDLCGSWSASHFVDDKLELSNACTPTKECGTWKNETWDWTFGMPYALAPDGNNRFWNRHTLYSGSTCDGKSADMSVEILGSYALLGKNTQNPFFNEAAFKIENVTVFIARDQDVVYEWPDGTCAAATDYLNYKCPCGGVSWFPGVFTTVNVTQCPAGTCPIFSHLWLYGNVGTTGYQIATITKLSSNRKEAYSNFEPDLNMVKSSNEGCWADMSKWSNYWCTCEGPGCEGVDVVPCSEWCEGPECDQNKQKNNVQAHNVDPQTIVNEVRRVVKDVFPFGKPSTRTNVQTQSIDPRQVVTERNPTTQGKSFQPQTESDEVEFSNYDLTGYTDICGSWVESATQNNGAQCNYKYVCGEARYERTEYTWGLPGALSYDKYYHYNSTSTVFSTGWCDEETDPLIQVNYFGRFILGNATEEDKSFTEVVLMPTTVTIYLGPHKTYYPWPAENGQCQDALSYLSYNCPCGGTWTLGEERTVNLALCPAGSCPAFQNLILYSVIQTSTDNSVSVLSEPTIDPSVGLTSLATEYEFRRSSNSACFTLEQVPYAQVCGQWSEAGYCSLHDVCGENQYIGTQYIWGEPGAFGYDDAVPRFTQYTEYFRDATCNGATGGSPDFSMAVSGSYDFLSPVAIDYDFVEMAMHPYSYTIYLGHKNVKVSWPDGTCADAIEYLNYKCPCGGRWLVGTERTVYPQSCPDRTCDAFKNVKYEYSNVHMYNSFADFNVTALTQPYARRELSYQDTHPEFYLMLNSRRGCGEWAKEKGNTGIYPADADHLYWPAAYDAKVSAQSIDINAYLGMDDKEKEQMKNEWTEAIADSLKSSPITKDDVKHHFAEYLTYEDTCGLYRTRDHCKAGVTMCDQLINNTETLQFGMPYAIVNDGAYRYNHTNFIMSPGYCGNYPNMIVNTVGLFTLVGQNAEKDSFTNIRLTPEVWTIYLGKSHQIYSWPDGTCADALEYLNYRCPCNGAWFPGSVRSINVTECPMGSCIGLSNLHFFANIHMMGYQVLGVSELSTTPQQGYVNSVDTVYNKYSMDGCFEGEWWEDGNVQAYNIDTSKLSGSKDKQDFVPSISKEQIRSAVKEAMNIGNPQVSPVTPLDYVEHVRKQFDSFDSNFREALTQSGLAEKVDVVEIKESLQSFKEYGKPKLSSAQSSTRNKARLSYKDVCGTWSEEERLISQQVCGQYQNKTTSYIFGMPGALAADDQQRYNSTTLIYKDHSDVYKQAVEFSFKMHGVFTLLGANNANAGFTEAVLQPEILTVHLGSSNMVFEWPDGSCDTALSFLNYNCPCDGAWYASSTRTVYLPECSAGSCPAFQGIKQFVNMKEYGYQVLAMSKPSLDFSTFDSFDLDLFFNRQSNDGCFVKYETENNVVAQAVDPVEEIRSQLKTIFASIGSGDVSLSELILLSKVFGDRDGEGEYQMDEVVIQAVGPIDAIRSQLKTVIAGIGSGDMSLSQLILLSKVLGDRNGEGESQMDEVVIQEVGPIDAIRSQVKTIVAGIGSGDVSLSQLILLSKVLGNRNGEGESQMDEVVIQEVGPIDTIRSQIKTIVAGIGSGDMSLSELFFLSKVLGDREDEGEVHISGTGSSKTNTGSDIEYYDGYGNTLASQHTYSEMCGTYETAHCENENICGVDYPTLWTHIFASPGYMQNDNANRFNMTHEVYAPGTKYCRVNNSPMMEISFGGTFELLGDNGDMSYFAYSLETMEVYLSRDRVSYHWPDGTCQDAMSYLTYECPCGGQWTLGETRSININKCPRGTCEGLRNLVVYSNVALDELGEIIALTPFSADESEAVDTSDFSVAHRTNPEPCYGTEWIPFSETCGVWKEVSEYPNQHVPITCNQHKECGHYIYSDSSLVLGTPGSFDFPDDRLRYKMVQKYYATHACQEDPILVMDISGTYEMVGINENADNPIFTHFTPHLYTITLGHKNTTISWPDGTCQDTLEYLTYNCPCLGRWVLGETRTIDTKLCPKSTCDLSGVHNWANIGNAQTGEIVRGYEKEASIYVTTLYPDLSTGYVDTTPNRYYMRDSDYGDLGCEGAWGWAQEQTNDVETQSFNPSLLEGDWAMESCAYTNKVCGVDSWETQALTFNAAADGGKGSFFYTATTETYAGEECSEDSKVMSVVASGRLEASRTYPNGDFALSPKTYTFTLLDNATVTWPDGTCEDSVTWLNQNCPCSSTWYLGQERTITPALCPAGTCDALMKSRQLTYLLEGDKQLLISFSPNGKGGSFKRL